MSWKYIQLSAERDLSNLNFPNGVITYKKQLGMYEQVNLDKSFIRLRCKLSKANGDQLVLSDNIAPAYLMANNLFAQQYQKMNGVTVAEVRQYVSQCGALMHRIQYPQSYKDNFLATTNFAKIDFHDRLNEVIVGGISDSVLNSEDQYASLSRLETFAGANIVEGADTLRLTANTGVFDYVDTVVDPLLPLNLTNALSVGDNVKITQPNASADYKVTNIYRITAVTALTFTVTPSPSVVIVAAVIGNHGIFNIRIVPKIKEVTRRSSEFELIFKPALGIWTKNRWIPPHFFQLDMYPHPEGTYQTNVIESIGSTKVHKTDFLFEVQDMILYLCVKNEKYASGEFNCTYDEIRCQIKNLTTTANVDHSFIVDNQTHTLTMALQDEGAQNNTLRSESLFKIRNNEELRITKYWMEYNGILLPNPYPNIQKTSSKDFLTQRYYESIMYSDANNHRDVESMDDWRNAGVFFTHKFGKTFKRTERAKVSTNFSKDAFGTGIDLHRPNLVLFDHFYRSFSMEVRDGLVRQVNADTLD